MAQTFDPFADVPPAEGVLPDAAHAGRPGGWQPPEETLVEQIGQILRRRKWVVLQALVIVTVIAFAYSEHQSTQYTAKSGLLFGSPTQGILPNSASSNAALDPTGQAATNGSLLSLPAVSTFAAQTTGGKLSAAEIKGAVTASLGSDGSSYATVSAVSGSPQLAAAIANAYAKGFVAFSKSYNASTLADAATQIAANIAKLSPADQSGTEGRTLKGQLATVQNAEALNQGLATVVQQASAPTSPSSPKTKRNVVLGVVVGLVLGLILAAVLERLDHRIADEQEFERIYGLPVLVEIPRVRELSRGELTFEVAERFRTLRTSLRYVNVDRDLRSVLIASPLPEDGKSTVARSLAQTMASMGDRVVLVELDLHKQGSPGHDGRGLSSVLIGEDLDEALISEPLPPTSGDQPRALAILPAGEIPPNPSELIDSARMREVLDELERRYDIVLLDAPAFTSVSDGLTLIPAVSAILIVAALGHTTTKAAIDLRRRISMLRGHPVGLVVNFTRRARRGKYYRYGS
jgi:capsular exopolysaccharide synthesis family protein